MSDEHNAVDAVGPDRRSFIKGLVATGVFAAPVISSFTMSGVQSVFGATPSRALMGNPNCTPALTPAPPPPGFGALVQSFTFFFVGQHYVMADGETTLTLDVANGALPNCTVISVYKVDPAAVTPLLPPGQTPLSGYAVVWNSPGNTQPNALAPLVLTVTNAPVVAGDTVYVFDKPTGQAVPNAVATNGAWTVSFIVDPGFVVTRAAAAAAIAVDPNFTG